MSKIKKLYYQVKNIKYISAILLTVIIAVQSITIINVYFEQKTGYHSDELYSYALSNSFYRPYMESDKVGATAKYNMNEWFSAKEFRDYLTVQEGQRFRYDSVWYNQSNDRHPPLYYVCLHTICSFFPDSFSFLYGFVLNLVLFAVMQIFMYKFGKNLLRSRYAALMMCLVYGYSSFVLNMTLFIRMYLMLTMFLVMLLYYHSKLIKLDRTDIKKRKLFLPVFLVTLAGSLTQYQFLLGAFVLAVCFCLRYLFQKRFRMFFIYGLTMLSGVLSSFAIFPAALGELFGEVEHAVGKYFNTQFKISLRTVFRGCFGWNTLKFNYYFMVIPALVFFTVLLLIPVFYLFREKPKVNNMLKSIRSFPGRIRNSGLKGIIKKIRSINPMALFMLLMIVVLIVVISYTINFRIRFIERYHFILTPLFYAVLFAAVFTVIRRISIRNLLITVFGAAILFSSVRYYYPFDNLIYNNDISVHDSVKDKDVLMIGVDRFYNNENISLFSYELYAADNVFCSSYLKYEEHLDEILDEDHDSEFCVLLNYSSKGEDRNGVYIYHNSDEEAVYVNDILDRFSSKGKYEYVGDYNYALGTFMLYRFV